MPHPSLLLIFLSLPCRKGEDGVWDVDNGQATETNATQFTVTSLQPYTVYSFRVVAVNALGMSQPSTKSYYMITLRERE